MIEENICKTLKTRFYEPTSRLDDPKRRKRKQFLVIFISSTLKKWNICENRSGKDAIKGRNGRKE